jgi:hypothetical protein
MICFTTTLDAAWPGGRQHFLSWFLARRLSVIFHHKTPYPEGHVDYCGGIDESMSALHFRDTDLLLPRHLLLKGYRGGMDKALGG